VSGAGEHWNNVTIKNRFELNWNHGLTDFEVRYGFVCQ
jgi:hypothetical protein